MDSKISETNYYIINNKGFYSNLSIYSYQIEELANQQRKLEIVEGLTKYHFEEYDGWKWKGDWNDPENADYKPEGYNPLLGTWKVTIDGETTENGWIFNKDREWADNAGGMGAFLPFEINDIGILLKTSVGEAYYKYSVATENGLEVVYLTGMYPTSYKGIKVKLEARK